MGTRKLKIGIAVLIAITFILPTGIMASGNSNEAVESRFDINSNTQAVPADGMGVLWNDGPWPVEIISCDFPSLMAAGEYDINITLERAGFTGGTTCIVDGDLDIGYTRLLQADPAEVGAMRLHFYVAADCDNVYFYMRSMDDPIDEFDLDCGGALFDEVTGGIDIAGLGTKRVEIGIPRSMLPVGDCNELGFQVDIDIRNLVTPSQNLATVLEPEITAIVAMDCGCVPIKAFADIYRIDPTDCIEIYSTDFEDTADIYNNWEAYDLPSADGSSPDGAIDTFRWNDFKSHSSSHSFHNSLLEDTYFGNQQDSLNYIIDNSEGYENIRIEFWHWMEGEILERYSGHEEPADYGVLQYSTDGGASWDDVPYWVVDDYCEPTPEEYLYGHYSSGPWIDTVDENPDSSTYGQIVWEKVYGKLEGMDHYPTIEIRWLWFSNPCIEKGGWYIDDVYICGEKPFDPDTYMDQKYSIDAFDMCEGTMKYTFPGKYTFEEGRYVIRYWLLTEDDCHFAVSNQQNRFVQEFEVRDFCDIAVIENEILHPVGPDPYDMGDYLQVGAAITNYGTVCCTDIPVTFTIREVIEDTLFDDTMEGEYYDVSGQKGFDPYSNDAFEFGPYNAIDFGAVDRVGEWHLQSDYFFSPTHAFACNDPGTHYYSAGMSDEFVVNMELLGIHPGDYVDALDFDFTGKINININPMDRIYTVLEIGNTWISFGATSSLGWTPAYGAYTGVWVEFSMKDIIGAAAPAYGLDPNMNPIFALAGNYLDGYGDGTWDSFKSIGILLDNTARTGTNGLAGGDWTGVMLDDLKISYRNFGATVKEEIIIIDELCPGEVFHIDDCDLFTWDDMKTGQYVECKSVPLDDPNECLYINNDNELCQEFTVSTQITCIDECDVESIDYTLGEDNHWHICTSNYDNYLVIQDPETGMYGYLWNDAVMLKSDDPRDMDSPASMDWSDDTLINVNMTYMADMEGYVWDPGFIEVNPHVSETEAEGGQWYTYTGPWWTDLFYGPGTDAFGVGQDFMPFGDAYIWGDPTPWMSPNFFTGNDYFTFDTSSFVNFDTGVYLDAVEPTFTDDMGFRFRFSSDSSWEEGGWYIDDISVWGANSGMIYEDNPCDDMDRFILQDQLGGDWWWQSGPSCWTCSNNLGGFIPNDVNTALVWTVDMDHAYKASLGVNIAYDLEAGYDYAYLEISNDGGNTWLPCRGYTGVGVDTVPLDLTKYIDQTILIRVRVETDEAVTSNYVTVCDMCITGFVDLEPPKTVGTISGTVLYGWYSSAVTFKATCSDDVSGCAATYYKIDGGSQLTYTNPVTINTNGEHQIEFWSVDNVGNEEVHQFTPKFKIDTGAAPSVSITAPTSGLYLFGNKLLDMSKTIIIGGFSVQATASDADSGVYSVTFQLDGTTFGESTTAPYTAYCGLKHTGAGTITAIAEDFTGQTAQATLSVTYFKFL